GSRAAGARGRLGVSSGRTGGCSRELGPRLRDLRRPQRGGDTTVVGGLARPPGPPLRVRFVLLRLWRPVGSTDARAKPTPADFTLRGDQARRRAPVLALLEELRALDRVASILHGLRPPAAARYGDSSLPQGCAYGRRDHALRRRRADARLHVHL